MSRRPDFTIIYLSGDRVVRADVDRGNLSPVQQWERPIEGDLPMLVETAIRGGGKPGRKVWVLATDIWMQTADLVSGAIAGAGSDELNQALAFEAEAFSGMNAIDSAVAHAELPSSSMDRSFWMIQLPAMQQAEIDEVVRLAGSKLAGICHPAGLPRSLGDESASWSRIELWPGLSLTITPAADRMDVAVSNVDPREGATSGERDVQVLVGDELRSLCVAGNVVRLDDETTFHDWLSDWAAVLSAGRCPVPVVGPPVLPPTALRKALLPVSIAAGVALLCIGHYVLLAGRIASADAKIEQLKRPEQQRAALDKQVDTLVKQQAEMTTQVDQLNRDVRLASRAFSVHRSRTAHLIDALARHRPPELVVQRVTSSAGNVKVRGIGLETRLVMQYARSLGQALSDRGWRVQSTSQTAMEMLPGGGPWSFELEIRDEDLDLPAPPPLPSTVASR